MPECRFSHVIFDLDGTILNTLEDLADACNWVCRQYGWPEHPVDAYRYFVGNGMAKLLERALPAQAQEEPLRQQVMEDFLSYYNDHKADKTRPYAGMAQAIARIKQGGVQVAVLTNKPHQAALDVAERYYPGVFDLVQGAMPQIPVKPDPTLLRSVMERMGATAQNTLFVGDSNVDIQTARNGGIPACGVLWGFRTRQELEEEGAQFIVSEPGELVSLIL